MATDRTFTIIKPNAVKAGHAQEIISIIEDAGFGVVDKKELELTREMAEGFYGEHKGKEFFERLITFMTSGPIVVIKLQKDNAVTDFRTLIGTTNPEEAAEGTIRKRFGTTTTFNAIHGSDSDENAEKEANFFF